MAEGGLAPGQRVALVDDSGVHLVAVPEPGDVVKVSGLGVLSHDLFRECSLGSRLELGRRTVRVLPPTPELVFDGLERRAQVITPPDAARIAHGCGIGPGSRVVEGGLGSGGLSTYLAFLVGDEGQLTGYELRADHLAVVERNLARAGLSHRATLHQEGLENAQGPCDAMVVDVPDPASIVAAAIRALVPGGVACFYTPLVDQMQAVRQALSEAPFERLRSMELLERPWVIHDRGARPSFEMLGHTGFLTFATRVRDR